MEIADHLEQFDRCLANEPPFCSTSCPFHADVLGIIEKFESGRISAAYRTYRDAVGLPRTVSAICPQPCKSACPLGESGRESGRESENYGSIELRKIERLIVAEAGDTEPNRYNLPHRGKHIAILGAGLAGLGCALRLASKNYGVSIYDSSDHIGESWMSGETLALFEQDVKEQFANLDYKLNFNFGRSKTYNMANLLLAGFDAVYVTKAMLGPDYEIDGADFGDGNSLRFAGMTLEIFRIGEHSGTSESSEVQGINSLADGFRAAQQIDGYFMTGQRTPAPEEPASRLVLHHRRLEGADFTPKQDATEEAARCLKCKCDACYEYCDLISYTGKWPLRIRDEVVSTTLKGSAELKGTPAKRLMSMCNMCGVCKEVCPEGIDIGALILAGRYRMHKLEKAPWAFHEYWISEMEHADGPSAKIMIPPVISNGGKSASYAFFPGCQLGAESPAVVSRTFAALRKQDPGMGLLVRCCGVPAEWAGDMDRHSGALSSIMSDWNSMGMPTLVLACPTCLKKFREHLPEIPVTSVYRALDANMAAHTIDEDGMSGFDRNLHYAVFDPCAAGDDEDMRLAVRELAGAAGLQISELPVQSEITRCCGYGGQPAIADPEYSKYAASRRAEESELPYITYCAGCLGAFAAQGKETVHILELFTGDERISPAAGPSQRRFNREHLKQELNAGVDDSPRYDFTLVIADEMAAKMAERKILESEIYEVVNHIRRSGRIVRNPRTGTHCGCKQIGHMTYWAEYAADTNRDVSPDDIDVLQLVNVWSHRMAIDYEPVWNGKVVSRDE
jgi:Fe-S oxidoreductase